MLLEKGQGRLGHYVDMFRVTIHPSPPGNFERGEGPVRLIRNLNLDHLHRESSDQDDHHFILSYDERSLVAVGNAVTLQQIATQIKQ